MKYNIATTPLHTEDKQLIKKWRKKRKVKQKKKFKRPEYYSYMQSKKWLKIRRRIVNNRKCCEICSTKTDLTVHHKTYKRLGRERDSDLRLLCWPCHKQEHPDKEMDEIVRQIAIYG